MGTRATVCLATILLLTIPVGYAFAQCVTPPPGLISWWPGDGDALDIAGANHATSFGGVSFVSGMVDEAFDLDGIDGYVTAGNDASVRPGVPFSVDFWVNVSSAGTFYGISSSDTTGNGIYSGFRVAVTATGGVMTAIGNNEGCCKSEFRRNFFTADGLIPVGEWHHVAAVFESATTQVIYVDGALQATTSSGLATYMAYGEGNKLQIGRIYDPGSATFAYSHGLVDEIELHSGILDSAAILAIFEAGSAGKCKGSPAVLDLGDAPDSPPTPEYPTLLANDGASHVITPGFYLGASVDADADGQPGPNALGDDDDGQDDEDGVTFAILVPGETASVDVVASADGFLDAWIDFGSDSSWNEAGDQIFTSEPLVAGVNSLSFAVPSDSGPGMTFARFRLSTSGGLSFDGPAPDGEVEDHEVAIMALDYGDAPDPTYPTLYASDGARHVLTPPLLLGSIVDPEPDGLPDPNVLGDDNDGVDDEDGVIFTTALEPGKTATAEVTVAASGILDAWIDFDGDGSWLTGGERIVSGVSVSAGTHSFVFTVPPFAAPGLTASRFRLSSQGVASFDGLALDGEVEDHEVRIDPSTEAFKWEQSPDASTLGVHVNTSGEFLLADDFECTVNGPITSLHIWAAWLNDVLPFDAPDSVRFSLSIHADIPAGPNPEDYSRPGDVLWHREFEPNEFTWWNWPGQDEAAWMDPPDGYLFPAVQDGYLYSFDVPSGEAFVQLGTATNPVVYWLAVKATPSEAGAELGWKTSTDHWNDSAVWVQAPDPYVGPWSELLYPSAHPLAGDPIDLAFRITGEEAPAQDYGDAPDPMHETLLARDGARHVIVDGFHLGASVDADPDGQPDATATGDDLDGNDDDDGVLFATPLVPGSSATIVVTASSLGYLNLWIDVGDDGSWGEAEDAVIPNVLVAAGANVRYFTVPQTGEPERMVFARVRFSTTPNLPWYGPAPDGEVEDYEVLLLADPTGVAEGIPQRLHLNQNVPNPFNPRTRIEFDLDRAGPVRMAVYDVRGTLVRVLVDDSRPAGSYTVDWNGRDDSGSPVASGVYLFQLQAHGERRITKALLLR